jgi:Uma2 family endonuclease
VYVRVTGNAFYADAPVVCGEAEIVHEARGGDSLLTPTVIIEVLSPSTEEYDRAQKFDDNYRYLPSLREYVLVAQDEAAIEIRSRDEAGSWTSRAFGAGDQAPILTLGCSLDVDIVYREARKNMRPA